MLYVQVKQTGVASRIEIIITSQGNSITINTSDVPGMNELKRYEFNLTEEDLTNLGDSITVKVIPYVAVGGSEKVGSASAEVTLRTAVIRDVTPTCTPSCPNPGEVLCGTTNTNSDSCGGNCNVQGTLCPGNYMNCNSGSCEGYELINSPTSFNYSVTWAGDCTFSPSNNSVFCADGQYIREMGSSLNQLYAGEKYRIVINASMQFEPMGVQVSIGSYSYPAMLFTSTTPTQHNIDITPDVTGFPNFVASGGGVVDIYSVSVKRV